MHVTAQRTEVRGSDQKMDVVGHQAIMMDLNGVFFKVILENLKECLEVLLLMKKTGLVVASYDRMIQPRT
jgi:hypothetical protein